MLVNKTNVMQVVKLELADGKPDSINLQPHSRAVPPPGAKIDRYAYTGYAKTIKGIEAYAPTVAEPSGN